MSSTATSVPSWSPFRYGRQLQSMQRRACGTGLLHFCVPRQDLHSAQAERPALTYHYGAANIIRIDPQEQFDIHAASDSILQPSTISPPAFCAGPLVPCSNAASASRIHRPLPRHRMDSSIQELLHQEQPMSEDDSGNDGEDHPSETVVPGCIQDLRSSAISPTRHAASMNRPNGNLVDGDSDASEDDDVPHRDAKRARRADEHIESISKKEPHWTDKVIKQMMFVSGETGDPSSETTILVEHIIQQQVKELLRRSVELANRRGSRTITPDELMFLYRGDKGKLNRLLHFLQWKDVRKNLNESEGGGGADADLAVGGDDVAGSGGGNVDPKKTAKKAKVQLLWDVSSFFSETVPAREDEDDEEEREMNVATLERLKYADERTRNMSKDDYMHWSECRQASFTYRKGKRFREWVGMDQIVGSKPNDDVLDILGFLTFEMVQTLTEEALKVKKEEDLHKKVRGSSTEDSEGNTRKRKREPGLFDGPEEEREPVSPAHIQEGFRRLQQPSLKQIYGSIVTRRPPPNTLKLF